MVLIAGDILAAFCVFYYCMIMLLARNPVKKSWWSSPMLMESLHLFMILGSAIMGLVLILKGILQISSVKEAGIQTVVFLCVLVTVVWMVKKMRVKERLAEFASLETGLTEINPPPSATPPHEAGPGVPPLKKAA